MDLYNDLIEARLVWARHTKNHLQSIGRCLTDGEWKELFEAEGVLRANGELQYATYDVD